MATYEIVRAAATDSPVDVVEDMPPTERGDVIFYQAGFWRVDSIEPAQSREADGRLIVTVTTDAPKN